MSRRRQLPGVCRTTGKIVYRTERRAKNVLLGAKIAAAVHGHRRRREQRYYPCQECTGYHLTSMSTPPAGDGQ